MHLESIRRVGRENVVIGKGMHSCSTGERMCSYRARECVGVGREAVVIGQVMHSRRIGPGRENV